MTQNITCILRASEWADAYCRIAIGTGVERCTLLSLQEIDLQHAPTDTFHDMVCHDLTGQSVPVRAMPHRDHICRVDRTHLTLDTMWNDSPPA